jgi:hypothetical protein
MKSHGEVKKINGRRVATPEYRSWQMLKNRCLNPNARDYAYYGGRGITVCSAWLSFEAFLADMGRRPAPEYTLDRIDADKEYAPDNCRWATRETQSRNRAYASTQIWDLADKLGVSQSTARHYLWVARHAHKGTPTRYRISEAATKIIKNHMGNKL